MRGYYGKMLSGDMDSTIIAEMDKLAEMTNFMAALKILISKIKGQPVKEL